jgi:HAD superfamily hydrolase (TIGR01450 family)
VSSTPVRGVLLDLEGTLFDKGAALPGAAAAVAALREQGLGVRFLTNIDSLSPAKVAAKLDGCGLDVPVGDLFTPVTAARAFFAAAPGTHVLTLLSSGLRDEFRHLEGNGPESCPDPGGTNGAGAAQGGTARHTHVLVGDCRDVLDYAVLDGAFRALRAGAELVALQRGRYFRREDGDHLDTGAVVAGLEYSAGVRARVLGKPSTDFFELAARSLGLSVQECVVVGDDATTDIAGGCDAGARAVQVRTGKYADQRSEGLTSSADATIDSIADLPALLAARLGS